MNAIEFVKHHGIEYTKGIIIGCESGFLPKNNNYEDLKQIVDAFELVESYGGIIMAKRQYSCFANACESVGVKQSPRVSALGKAINLVEQCNA